MMYNRLMGQSWIGLWAFYFCKNNRVSGDSPNIQQTDVKSEQKGNRYEEKSMWKGSALDGTGSVGAGRAELLACSKQ